MYGYVSLSFRTFILPIVPERRRRLSHSAFVVELQRKGCRVDQPYIELHVSNGIGIKYGSLLRLFYFIS